MEAIVSCIFGPERSDIKFAANELTENVEVLDKLAPKQACIPEESRPGLQFYGEVKYGLIENVRETGKGYELLAAWMNALYEYAQYTDQLSAT